MKIQNPCDVDTALIAQKDLIIERIIAAYDAESLRRVLDTLEILRDLWTALGYGHKYRELAQWVRDTADSLIMAEEEDLNHSRKERREQAEQTIERLEVIRALALVF